MAAPPIPASKAQPRVVIVGAGFGGLYAARALGKLPVHLTVVDRKNHHTFQPLLYQAATAGLSPGDIATPVRRILRRNKNTEVLMAEAVGFGLEKKTVHFREMDLSSLLQVARGTLTLAILSGSSLLPVLRPWRMRW